MTGVSSALTAAGLNACSPKTAPTAPEPQSPFAGQPKSDRPNIIVFLADTLRADHLSCYGYPAETSPAIDWLAGQGVVFENYTSGSNWTKPAVGTMMTGVPARVHRAVVSSELVGEPGDSKYRIEILRDTFTTLATTLKSVGYSTAYLQSNPHARPEFGYGRGFDTAICDSSMIPKLQVEKSLRWIETTAHEPFFLFIHEIDPHGPYEPLTRSFMRLHGAKPATFLERLSADEAERVTRYVKYLGTMPEIIRGVRGVSDEANRYIQMKYDAEIYQLDSLIEQFALSLARLEIMDHTVFALTSDHGEAFGEHGTYGHGSGLAYDELVHIPLLMVGGGLPRGVRVPHNTTMLDFYPTLLELAKASKPPYVSGEPMFSAQRELLVTEDRLAYIDMDRQGANLSDWDAAIIKGRYKVATHKKRTEFMIFDRESDPGEHRNLVGTGVVSKKIEEDLIATLQSKVAAYEELGRTFGEPEWMDTDDTLREELEALGYA